MKIAVIGAGIFGISAAVKLVRAGHEVDLYEKIKIFWRRLRGLTNTDFIVATTIQEANLRHSPQNTQKILLTKNMERR